MANPVTVEKFGVGQSVRRIEDPRLLQGFGRYADDVSLPHQAYAVVVRSPRLAVAVDSVGLDVFSLLDLPSLRVQPLAAPPAGALAGGITWDRPGERLLFGWRLADDTTDIWQLRLGRGSPTRLTRSPRPALSRDAIPRPALVRDRARHVGDPVALVVARTMEQAVDAAELVAVDYQPLPAVAATADAMRAGAPAVWAEAPDNIAFVWEAGKKDETVRAIAGAAHVTKLDYVVTRVAAAPMEPRGAVGEWDRRTGRYTLHTGIQAPHGLRTLLADQVFKIPQSHLRVVTGEVGGSFGMKSGVYPEVVLVLWAAKRLGRPVKWTSDRREGFVTDEHGRPSWRWTPTESSWRCAWPSA